MYIPRAAVAVLVLLSINTLAAPSFADSSKYANAPKQQREDGCHILSRGPGVDLSSENPGLHAFLNDFLDAFKNKAWKSMKSYFHTQSRVKASIGQQIEAILLNRYQKPWQFSVYRVWEIKDKDYNKKPHNCPNTEFERIITRFGYPTQYFVILQIMGQNELGRILVIVAPDKKNQLAIIGFHIQQWTHQGLDWQKWSEKGNAYLKEKNMKQAYLAYSVAGKMLEGGDFIHYLFREEILTEQKKIFDDVALISTIREEANNEDIVYAASLMHNEGTGLFVRVTITKEETSAYLIAECKKIGAALLKKGWLQEGEGGVKCSFIPKGSDPKQDSVIGGFYIPQSDFTK